MDLIGVALLIIVLLLLTIILCMRILASGLEEVIGLMNTIIDYLKKK